MHDTKLENEAAKRARAKFPAEQYRIVNGVTVFAEHEREHDGETINFDLEALAAIVNSNNQRIVETGSFSPLIEGHTTGDPKDSEKPTLGFEGPYRLHQIGEKNPKWAICCDEYHKLKHAEKLDDLPRRSPELWLTDDPEKRFFDPIAALGGTTPKLDLGLAFRRTAGTEGAILKYSAPTVAAGSNTFVPTETKLKHQQEESEDMDPEHFVDLVMNTDTMKRITELLPALEDLVGGGEEELAPEGELAEPEPELLMKEADEEPEEKVEYENKDEEENDMKAEDYKKEAHEAKLRYARLERDHKALRAEVDSIVQEKTDLARTARLDELKTRYAMDEEKEAKRCLYAHGSKWTDDEFNAHVELIEGNYTRLPMHEDRLESVARHSRVHPEFEGTPGALPHRPAAGSRIADNPGGIGDRELADRIVKYANEKANRGEKITFAQAKADVQAGNGQA